MKTMIRTQVIFAVGLLALPFTAQLAQAQSCAPGMGMTTSTLLSGVYGRPAAANFTSYSFASTASNFLSPTSIQPTSANHAFVLDNGRLLSLIFNPANGGSLEGLPVGSPSTPISALVGMAWVSGHLWVASSNQLGAADDALLTPALSLPDGGVGSMIFDGSYLWISHPTGAHTGTLTKVSLNLGPDGIDAAPTFTQVAVPNAVGLNHMTFDGQYLWAAGTALSGGAQTLFKINPSTGTAVDYASTPAAAPQALTFDGYSIWVADLINVARIDAATGARTGTYNASDARSLSFDGVQMWVAERSANTIVPIRACDGASVLNSLTTPAYPEHVAFDGTNLWVTSPTSKTVSIR